MAAVSNAKEYEKELTRIFNRFNHKYWNDELPEVIITFVPTLKAYGHMTSNPVWVSENESPKYELNIDAYSLDRSPEEICATLLHEQVHLYCNIHKINDTSNHNRYHNKRFKSVAEDHGLVVSYSDSIGWSLTELNEDAKKYVKKLNIKPFEFRREHVYKGSNLKRFTCPICGIPKVYSVANQNVLCGNCLVSLVEAPRKKGKVN